MGISILIVDDDKDDIELFKEVVSDIDATLKCQSALCGMEAITLLEEGKVKPDIIVVDLNMPMLNGTEFIRIVRENKTFNRIKLFLYSTCDVNKSLVDLVSIGADGFFRKPTRYMELYNKVSDLIQECLNPSAPNS
jgi:CheY-like chemotaxis protein